MGPDLQPLDSHLCLLPSELFGWFFDTVSQWLHRFRSVQTLVVRWYWELLALQQRGNKPPGKAGEVFGLAWVGKETSPHCLRFNSIRISQEGRGRLKCSKQSISDARAKAAVSSCSIPQPNGIFTLKIRQRAAVKGSFFHGGQHVLLSSHLVLSWEICIAMRRVVICHRGCGSCQILHRRGLKQQLTSLNGNTNKSNCVAFDRFTNFRYLLEWDPAPPSSYTWTYSL